MSIYIIRGKANLYRVCKSTQRQRNLISRYSPELDNPDVLFHHGCNDTFRLEFMIHKKLYHFKNKDANFEINYYTLVKEIIDCIDMDEYNLKVDAILDKLNDGDILDSNIKFNMIAKDLALLYWLDTDVKMRITNTNTEEDANSVLSELINKQDIKDGDYIARFIIDNINSLVRRAIFFVKYNKPRRMISAKLRSYLESP